MVWCSEKISSALTQLAGEGRSKELFLAAVREAIAGMTKLCGFNAPPSAYITLQQVCSFVHRYISLDLQTSKDADGHACLGLGHGKEMLLAAHNVDVVDWGPVVI